MLPSRLTRLRSASAEHGAHCGLALNLRKTPAQAVTAAETHAVIRLMAGFTLDQMVSEYRALRTGALSQWLGQMKAGTKPRDGQDRRTSSYYTYQLLNANATRKSRERISPFYPCDTSDGGTVGA
jgi:hypothetical protein